MEMSGRTDIAVLRIAVCLLENARHMPVSISRSIWKESVISHRKAGGFSRIG